VRALAAVDAMVTSERTIHPLLSRLVLVLAQIVTSVYLARRMRRPALAPA
jgi:hypothetical protein